MLWLRPTLLLLDLIKMALIWVSASGTHMHTVGGNECEIFMSAVKSVNNTSINNRWRYVYLNIVTVKFMIFSSVTYKQHIAFKWTSLSLRTTFSFISEKEIHGLFCESNVIINAWFLLQWSICITNAGEMHDKEPPLSSVVLVSFMSSAFPETDVNISAVTDYTVNLRGIHLPFQIRDQ